MERSFDEIYRTAKAKAEQEAREEGERLALRAQERKQFLEAFLGGPDMLSWVMPCDDIVGKDVLAEHFQQIRNVVRFALQHALDDRRGAAVNLSAASTAARLIQTNIALAKALGVTSGSNSKTVRGGRTGKEPQD